MIRTISRNLSNTMGEKKWSLSGWQCLILGAQGLTEWFDEVWKLWESFVDFEDLISKGDFFFGPTCETMLSTWCFKLETISFRVEKDRGGEARKYLENVGFSLIMFIISRNLSNTMTQFTLWGKKSSNSWKQFSGHKCGDFCCVLQAAFVMLLV